MLGKVLCKKKVKVEKQKLVQSKKQKMLTESNLTTIHIKETTKYLDTLEIRTEVATNRESLRESDE